MKSGIYFVVAVIAGLVAAFVLIVAVEVFSSLVHPFPAEFKGTSDEVCRHVENYPAWILAVVVPMWAGTAFVGSWVAQRIGGVYASAMIAVALLAGLILNISMLPYPTWFEVACLIAIPAASLVATKKRGHQNPAAKGTLS
jgi:hypothetical protein